jgi:hypothetical protein
MFNLCFSLKVEDRKNNTFFNVLDNSLKANHKLPTEEITIIIIVFGTRFDLGPWTDSP